VVRGTHASADGRTFGPFTLRFEVLFGLPHVRLTYSFVFAGDPDADFVRSSEVVLRAHVGGRQRMGFGGDDGREVRMERQRAPWTADFRHAELYQDSVSHWRVRRWVDRERRDVFCEEGTRSDGWMELSGDAGRVAAAVRDFWQNHPKALAADAGTGHLRVGLYPEKAERLDLRRYSNRVYVHAYEAPCTWKKETIPFDPAFGAHGIRKTHDMLLMMDEPNPSGAAFSYNHPLTLDVTPAALARTGVVVPASRSVDAAWRGRIGGYLDFLGDAMLRDGGTGYLDYFDLPEGFDTRSGRWHHDYGGLGYDNDEGMPCLGLWQAYLLTGREDALAMARAMARHNSDVDSHHIGRWAGYGSRHNVNHWGDMDKEPRISQPVGKRFLYYLAGDRSVLDLVGVMLEMWDRQFSSPKQAGLTALVPALASTLLVAEETGLRDARTWLTAIADALAGSLTESGQLRARLTVDARGQAAQPVHDAPAVDFMMLSSFGGIETFAELAERYDHRPLRDALVRYARYLILPRARRQALDPGFATPPDSTIAFRALNLLGYAFAVTGDRTFPAYARPHLARPLVRIGALPCPRYGRPGAASRPAPFGVPAPDAPRGWEQRARRFYPFFAPTDIAQFFQIAGYLHKAQGVMLLAAADRSRSSRRRIPCNW
jgi:hypothetical protein